MNEITAISLVEGKAFQCAHCGANVEAGLEFNSRWGILCPHCFSPEVTVEELEAHLGQHLIFMGTDGQMRITSEKTEQVND